MSLLVTVTCTRLNLRWQQAGDFPRLAREAAAEVEQLMSLAVDGEVRISEHAKGVGIGRVYLARGWWWR